MSITTRTWLAGVLLSASVLLIVASADVHDLAVRSMLGMTVVLCHAWVLAVGERIGTVRGGRTLTRFPLGPRLLMSRPGLAGQCLLPALLFGAVTMDWRVALLGVGVVLMLTVDVLRHWLPYAIPVALVFMAVSTMKEFHTLGDLVATAHGWMIGLVWLVIWVTLLAGPLLRTDVGGRLATHGKLTLLLAGLPGYAGAIFVLGATPLGESLPDVLAVAFVLLAGSVVQSVVLGLFGKAVGLVDREPGEMPEVSAYDVGLALVPFLLVPVTVLSLEWLTLSSHDVGLGTPAMWQMLLVMGLIVPAVPAAALVAASLDRLDGRGKGMVSTVCAVGALGLWFVFGPGAMQALYSGEGLIEGLRGVLPGSAAAPGVIVGVSDQAAVSAGLPGDDVALWGLPAADMLRASTLMLLALAAWSTRILRHAPRRLMSPGAAPQMLAVLVAGLGAWVLVPRVGATGAPLAVAAAATLAMALDLVAGVKVAPLLADESIDALDFNSPLLDELALEGAGDVVDPELAAAAAEAAPVIRPSSDDDELSFSDWSAAQVDETDDDRLPA